MILQNWNHGYIEKTFGGKYLYISGNKRSPEYGSMADLVRGETPKPRVPRKVTKKTKKATNVKNKPTTTA